MGRERGAEEAMERRELIGTEERGGGTAKMGLERAAREEWGGEGGGRGAERGRERWGGSGGVMGDRLGERVALMGGERGGGGGRKPSPLGAGSRLGG